MACFQHTLVLPRRPGAIFDHLIQPANWLELAPPELHLEITDAPPRLFLGARTIARGRRWGLTQRVVSEVTTMEAPFLFVEKQLQGPLLSWVHTQRFDPLAEGTRVEDTIDFQLPGGLLGKILTEGMIQRELAELFAYRSRQLQDRFKSEAV